MILAAAMPMTARLAHFHWSAISFPENFPRLFERWVYGVVALPRTTTM